MNADPVLVIGGRGLLGHAVVRELGRRGVVPHSPTIRWGRPEAIDDLTRAVDAVLESDRPWTLFWLAGAGVTQTPQQAFDEEIAVFTAFARHLSQSAAAHRGSVFFASSAGGVYAGASHPPFTEATEPRPLAPYGHTKLQLEGAVTGLADAGIRVAIGRIANLYGPGQNLAKPQGLISQLCLSLMTNKPLGVYVPLDTLRDYIYVEDAAALIIDFTRIVAAGHPGTPAVTKIIATGQAISIAEVLGELRLIARRRPPLVLAASPHASTQARDLRVRSTVLTEVDYRGLTPFPVGFARTLADIGARVRNP